MYIANPMYDTVFKFLLEDQALAKLLIGTIIQEEIVTLDVRPQERTSEIGSRGERILTVYRVDFAARIRNRAGEERQVLIELQKAKYPTDIMRFRRYLGAHYRDPDNSCEIDIASGKGTVRRVRQGLPLLTIYFLGHSLDHTDAPVIQVRRDCIDLASGNAIECKEAFIESLTHDSYVIQIPKLHRQHRTEIEEMLQLFDQRRIHGDRHFLAIDEGELSERYHPLLRRLQRAAAEPRVAATMELEDEVLEEIQEIERSLERVQAEKEQIQAEKEQVQAEKEQAQAEKEQESTRANRERAEKERLLDLLKQAGIDPEGRS